VLGHDTRREFVLSTPSGDLYLVPRRGRGLMRVFLEESVAFSRSLEAVWGLFPR
jgi:hypothetical protein